MAFNEQEEAKVRELLTAFENGKRINELEPTEGLTGSTLIEVMDSSGETRKMELEAAVAEAGNPIAGRWWDSWQATTKAGGWFGSLEALRKLPETLGLGRYLVTDDLQMRKLDPLNSRRFEDGSPAALDGSMGQCMWCWSRPWYFTRWSEGNRDIWAISLKPIEGKKSYRIPVGGTSWLGAGVMDRTTQTLCSLISEDERYRGGIGKVNPAGCSAHPAAGCPQMSMLGMATTNLPAPNFAAAARKRGDGWEANWFVAKAAVQILISVIMGERNIQAPFNAARDVDGLMQGGFGAGVTTMNDSGWGAYNNYYPLVPTCVGVEAGDRTTLVSYTLPKSENAEEGEKSHMFMVPCFYGLMHAGYGHLGNWVRGMVVKTRANETAEVYVAGSMKEWYDLNTTEGLIKVAEAPLKPGWIKRLSMEGLCGVPTEVGGSESTYFADYYYRASETKTGLYMCDHSGMAGGGAQCGMFSISVNYTQTSGLPPYSAALCFFAEDPVVEL